MRATRARARVVRGDGDGARERRARTRDDASRARVVVGRRAVEGDEGDAATTTTREDGGTDHPLRGVMFPWERAVLHSERWAGELKPWQKAYWAAFALGCAFVVGSRAKRYYDDQESEEERRRSMEANKRALRGALEGRSFIGASGEDEEDEDEDPFDGMSPEEIEALVKREAGPSGDVYDGMTPEEINEYEEKFRGKGNLTWKTKA